MKAMKVSLARQTAFTPVRRVSQLQSSQKTIWKKPAAVFNQNARSNRFEILLSVSSAHTTESNLLSAPATLARSIFSISSLSRPLLACCLAAAALALFPSIALAASKMSATVDPTTSTGLVAFAKGALSFILHLDVHLGEIIAKYGTATYAILFSIVFAETGLVITPFLPGDSLLFATGALAALGKLNILVLLAVYITAATIGDAVNYALGNYFGDRALRSSLIKRKYIEQTERFYDEYGGKTIILARFVPIIRTFAPFVAGIGSMPYKKFGLYNIAGAILWTAVCVGAGFAFGNVPAVHENFSLVVLGIVAVSLVPIVYEIVAAQRGHGGKKGGKRIGSVGLIVKEGSGGSLSAQFRV